jgi:uncharacterized membrane protein YidH (DUF202 family)
MSKRPPTLSERLDPSSAEEAFLLAEAQVLLAEKRTSLSAVRTGIAIVALPLSITSVLIATSRMYSNQDVAHLLIPVLAACALLFLLGCYLIVRALIRMRHHDQKLAELRTKSASFAQLFDE